MELLHTQAHGGLVQQLMRHRPGTIERTVLRAEHVRVAKTLLSISCHRRSIVARIHAAQPVIEPVTPNRFPQSVHAYSIERQQLLHGVNALTVQARLHAGAYARQVAQLKVRDGTRKLRGQKANQPVGFLHVAGDLGQKPVRRHADRAVQGLTYILSNCLLDVERNRARDWRSALAADQLADHLVNGRRVRNRANAFHGCGDGMRVLGINRMGTMNQNDFGTDLLSIAHPGSRAYAQGFGLVAGGNAAGGVALNWDDRCRFTPVLGVQELLDRGKEAVQVDMQSGKAVQLERRRHSGLPRLYSPYVRL